MYKHLQILCQLNRIRILTTYVNNNDLNKVLHLRTSLSSVCVKYVFSQKFGIRL